MSGGGKGSSDSSTTVELPAWMEDAYQKSLAMSEEKAKMGYVPYIGPDVAAIPEQSQDAMQSMADTSALFGMSPNRDIRASLPVPTDYGNGVKGYSSFPMFEQAQNALSTKYPGLDKYLKSFFIDPKTGAMPADNAWDRANASVKSKTIDGGETSSRRKNRNPRNDTPRAAGPDSSR